MMVNFLAVLFLAGVFLASLQDLKRREVDNYLNFFLLVSGAAFLVFLSIWQPNIWFIVWGLLCFAVVFLLANIFYYGRVFAGGDAKLLIALFSLFVAASFKETFVNLGLFIVFLLISGSVYGIFYTGFLIFRNFSRFKKEAKKEMKNKIFIVGFIFAIVFLSLGIFFNLFLLLAGLFFLFAFLFVAGKAVENTSMIKFIKASECREGDWLVSSVRVGKKNNLSGLGRADKKRSGYFKGK